MITAAGAAALAALVLAAGPAPAGQLGVSPGDGVLQAAGAAVEVPVAVTCPRGWDFDAGLEVAEAVGDAVAKGSGHEHGACTGGPQQVRVYVQAAGGPHARAFRAGPASVVATLSAERERLPGVVCPMGWCPVNTLADSLTDVAAEGSYAQARSTATVRLHD